MILIQRCLGLLLMFTASMPLLATIAYKDQGLLPPVTSDHFTQLDVRLGTMTTVEINTKARVPSLRVVMDFGPGFDELKQSSAQLQDNYYEGMFTQDLSAADGRRKAQLHGMQVAAVTNFPKRSVGIPSFFLTLGMVSLEGESTGTVVVKAAQACPNGSQLKLLNDAVPSVKAARKEMVEYAHTFHHLDIRVGTVLDTSEQLIDFGSEIGRFHYKGEYPLLHTGMQVLRIINLSDLSGDDNIVGIVDEDGQKIPLTLERSLPNGHFLK